MNERAPAASLVRMQAEAVRWCLEVAGQRQCRPLEGAALAPVFAAMEKDARSGRCQTIRSRWPPRLGRRSARTSAQVGKVSYSVPWRHIGKTADVRVTGKMVKFIGGELVKTHPGMARGKQTDFSHYPPDKLAFPHADPGGHMSAP